jgi:hypothetical protein
MKALLSQWKANAQQDKEDPAYQQGLEQALKVLDKSASLPEMVAKLRRLEMQSVPSSS